VSKQPPQYEQNVPQVESPTSCLDLTLSPEMENQTFSGLSEQFEYMEQQQLYHTYLDSPSLAMADINFHHDRVRSCAEEGYPSAVIDTILSPDTSAPMEFPSFTSYPMSYESSLESDSDSQADDKDSKHISGSTPLHRAAFFGHEAVIGTLIAGGADCEARNRYGLSALHLAALRGHLRIMTLLLGQGADMSALTQGGKTALHLAAKRGEEGIVWILLKETGTDSNARDLKGQTALHLACEKGHVGVVRALIEWGADLGCRDYEGRTPLQRAGAMLKERLESMFSDMGLGC
jgi:ankyrin repeat protein